MLIARLGVISSIPSHFIASITSSNFLIFNWRKRLCLVVVWPFLLLLLVTGNGWADSNAGNRLDRLQAEADNLHWSLDQADYSITANDSCEYRVESADYDIQRMIYFDPDGNRHVVKRDHYGNRFGTSVDLSDTALGGVISSEGTLFIKLRNRYRWYYGGRLIVRLDIPHCGVDTSDCLAMAENFDDVTVPVGSDPLFIEHAAGNDSGAAGFSIFMESFGSGVTRCESRNSITGELILIEQSEGGIGDTFQILRLSDTGISLDTDVAVPLSREESAACGLELGCNFP